MNKTPREVLKQRRAYLESFIAEKRSDAERLRLELARLHAGIQVAVREHRAISDDLR